MAKKWNDKVARREEKLFEVNRLAILDLCARKSMDYTELRDVIENLPPVADIVATPEMTESEIEELFDQSTQSQEEIPDFEVDSSFQIEDFSEQEEESQEIQELEELEENKEELEQNDEIME